MKDKLESVLGSLWLRSRFVSYFYQSVRFAREAAVPTLALSISDSRLVMYYNPSFIAGMGEEELIGLLVHEMLHVVLGHDHRAAGPSENAYLRNLAQDMVINSYLAGARRTFFSKGSGKGEPAPELLLPRGLPIVPAAFIAGTGIPDPTWEEVYRWLVKRPVRQPGELVPGINAGEGDGDGQADADREGPAFPVLPGFRDDAMAAVNVAGLNGLMFTDENDVFLPTGTHLLEDRLALDGMDAKKSAILSVAGRDTEMAQERPFQSISGIIARVREAESAEWRHLLKSVIDFSAQSNEWTYTYGRFNRRYFAQGIYSPGRVFKEQETITVAVDVSGSMVMTPSDIESAFGVVEDLLGKYRVNLVCVDDDLFIPEKAGAVLARSRSTDRPFLYTRGDWKYIRTGSGGTTMFSPLFNRYMKGRREMLMVITDGYVYDLERLLPYTPTIWVVSENRSEPFRPPFGRTVRIRERARPVRYY
ncbi:MAG TPA: hypothetical protein PK307_15500 [Spirochaetota bacterium]|nr:hypothetical protein [Spirochaetota bacterium]HOD13846.1 hypothetical protein [Spirochaetota bacterium]HPG51924.1 hypothetical protein [Spirochaetota bacterium]HPN14045.1 hypothetical protein [Spirochaetota bacterium]HQL83607.1 hypothetical protein [Spirochaetota bacterium]